MAVGRPSKFNDKQLLTTMLNLRWSGYGTDVLAVFYGSYRGNIDQWCKRYHVEPFEHIYSLEHLIKPVLKEDKKWKVIDGEKVIKGRTYQEYLKQSKYARSKKAYWC